jgi:uncharacterized protein YkuJ
MVLHIAVTVTSVRVRISKKSACYVLSTTTQNIGSCSKIFDCIDMITIDIIDMIIF